MKNRKYANGLLISTIVGVAGIVASTGVSALTYQTETDMEFTINPSINVSLSSNDLIISDLTPGTSSDSNVVTVDVSTNAGYGYYLAATAGTSSGSTDLVNTADNSYTFGSLSSTAAGLVNFADNKWGYSYSTDNGTNWVSGDSGNTTAGYAGLPLDNDDNGATGVKLLDTNSYVSSGSVKFKIGAKAAATQASGTYTNTVNFYAVSNPVPMSFDEAYAAAGKSKVNGYYTMQDATSSICTAVDEGQVGQVIDTRDDTVYHIGKLADGKCWMLDNLALDPTAVSLADLQGNTNASDTTLNYLKNGGGTTSDKYPTAKLNNEAWTSYSQNYYSIPMVNTDSINTVPSDATSTAGGWKVGVYYNFCAASAGSYCYGDGTSAGTSSGNATEDICPAGWRMPTGGDSGEYQALYSNSNYNTYDNYRAALHLPLSGVFFSGSAHYQGSVGVFWSSTRYNNNNMYYLYLTTSYVYPADYTSRDVGFPMRCVLGS